MEKLSLYKIDAIMPEIIFRNELFYYPELKIESKEKLLKEIISLIKAPIETNGRKGIMMFLNNKSILTGSAYSFLIEKDNLFLLLFNNATNKLEHINIQTIEKVAEDNFNENGYRPLNVNEIKFHTTLIKDFPIDTNSGWSNYWKEFNREEGKYKVRERTQYWNNVRNIEFKLQEFPDLKCFIEVVSKFGRKRELIIHLLILFVEDPDSNAKALEAKKFKDLLPSTFFKKNKEKSFCWNISKGKQRLKIELANTPFDRIETDTAVHDPRLHPSRLEHFKWFQDHLDKITEEFEEFLR